MPNIKGDLRARLTVGKSNIIWNNNLTGDALATTNIDTVGASGLATSDGIASGFTDITFDASRSSAVYGKSQTVQPKSIQLISQIKY